MAKMKFNTRPVQDSTSDIKYQEVKYLLQNKNPTEK